MNNHVLIVGAGVVGAATALSLAEQGFKVSMIDGANQLGQGASGANGAQLSYRATDVLASVDTLKSIPKLLFGLDSAFRFHPKLESDFIAWTIKFLTNCTQKKSDLNTLKVLKIALKSQTILNKWREEYGFEFDHRQSQKLHMFENQSAFEHASKRVDLKNQYGANQSLVSYKQALDLEPKLEKVKANYVGGVYTPGDEVGDVLKFTKVAIGQALKLGSGELHLSTELLSLGVEGMRCHTIVTSKGEMQADYLVICTGYQSRQLAQKLEIKIPLIMPMSGYSLTYPITIDTPEISLTDTKNRIVLCRLGNKLRIAGMADMGKANNSLPQNRIDTLRQITQSKYPSMGNYQKNESAWTGTRAMSVNGQPIVSQTKLSNVFVNTGHGMLGWTLAAGAAKILTNMLLQRQ